MTSTVSVELPITDGAGLSQEVSHCIYLDCRQSSDREDKATPANQPTKAVATAAAAAAAVAAVAACLASSWLR